MNPETVYCPGCGKPLKVLQAMRNRHYGEHDTYVCLCTCGTYDITITEGRISAITLRKPDTPSLYD